MYPARSSRRAVFAAASFTGMLTLAACTSTGEGTSGPTLGTESTAVSTAAPQPQWSEQLIDGPEKPEDLVRISSGAVIVSGMSADPGSAGGGSGSLYAMDPDTGEMTNIWPQPGVGEVHDTARFGECPGPPDTTVVSPHGLGLEITEDGTEYLYVVNHGGRESVEVFEVGDADAGTQLTWVGCSVLPDASFGNGVVEDPNSDGFYVTHFLDPADMEGEFERAFAGEPTGALLHWTPETGWRQVPGSEMSTPNGIAVSEDGSSLYVASWGGRELIELEAATGDRINTVPLGFMPDNLRPTADGRILVTGQVIDTFETFMGYEFGDLEPEQRYDVYALSPDTFTIAPVAEGGIPGFGNPTTALEVDDTIFVGSVAGDKVLRLDAA